MGDVIPQSFFAFISTSGFPIIICSALIFWSSTACISGVHPRGERSFGNLRTRMRRAARLFIYTAYVAGKLWSGYMSRRHYSQWLSTASVRQLQHPSIGVKKNIHILSPMRFIVCSSCSASCAISRSSCVFFSTAWSSSRCFCVICVRNYAVYDYRFCARNWLNLYCSCSRRFSKVWSSDW